MKILLKLMVLLLIATGNSFCRCTEKVVNDTIVPVMYNNTYGYFVDEEAAKKQQKKMMLADSLVLQNKRQAVAIKSNNVAINKFEENEKLLKQVISDEQNKCNLTVKSIYNNQNKQILKWSLIIGTILSGFILSIK